MNYQAQDIVKTMVQGWTRIEMLLELYDRTILAVESTKLAFESSDENATAVHRVSANRLLLGLYSGLDVDGCAIAGNVGRLLLFVMTQVAANEFDVAIEYLHRLQSSFAEIKDLAIDLEKKGQIPPVANAKMLDTVA